VSSEGGAFYQKSSRGNTYGGTGGTTSHIHVVSLVSIGAGASTIMEWLGTNVLQYSYPRSHLRFTISLKSAKYKNLQNYQIR